MCGCLVCYRPVLALASGDRGRSPLFFFFFNDTATTEIYTLSLHDALPILCGSQRCSSESRSAEPSAGSSAAARDRKSTRLNSSHPSISYAVFCLKKKNKCALRHLSHPNPQLPLHLEHSHQSRPPLATSREP